MTTRIELSTTQDRALFALIELPESGPHHDTVGRANPCARIRAHAFTGARGPGRLRAFLEQNDWLVSGLELVTLDYQSLYTVSESRGEWTVTYVAVG